MLDSKENFVKSGGEGLDIRRMVSRMRSLIEAGEVWRRRIVRELLWRRDGQAPAQTPRGSSPHAYQCEVYAKNRWFSTIYIINDFNKFCFDGYRSGSQF